MLSRAHETVSQPAPAAKERTVFEPSGLRQAMFALALLVLSPFALGLVVMIARRLIDGLYYDVPALLVLMAGLTAIMMLLALELNFSLRARLEIGRSALRFTMPAFGGPLPLWTYTREELPYHVIRAVELRREIFGGRLAPVVLRALVLRTKDNREITVGHTLEGFDDPAFPFDEIAAKIGERTALSVLDNRTVWRRTPAERRLPYISSFDTEGYIVDPPKLEGIARDHRRLVLGLASALAALLLLGAMADYAAR